MKYLLILSLPFLLISCIGDDLIEDRVAARVMIANPIESLALGDTFLFTSRYFNEVGLEEMQPVQWESNASDILSIDPDGRAIGLTRGEATVYAHAQSPTGTVSDSLLVSVADETVAAAPTERSGIVQTTTFYLLEGSFTLSENENGQLVLAFGDDYRADSALPGLYVYLTNNPNTVQGAFTIGEVTIFEGAHSYTLPDSIGLNDFSHVLYFCKPFNVKVGDGEIE